MHSAKLYSLKAGERLRGRKEFDELFQKGKRLTGKFVVIYYLPNNKRKVGFTVSKHYRRAVDRNRIKRLLREVYRQNKTLFRGRFIFFAKYSKPLPQYSQILADVLTLGQQIENH